MNFCAACCCSSVGVIAGSYSGSGEAWASGSGFTGSAEGLRRLLINWGKRAGLVALSAACCAAISAFSISAAASSTFVSVLALCCCGESSPLEVISPDCFKVVASSALIGSACWVRVQELSIARVQIQGMVPNRFIRGLYYHAHTHVASTIHVVLAAFRKMMTKKCAISFQFS